MSASESYKDVRELAREIATTMDPSALDWTYLYSNDYRNLTDWHRDFEYLVEQSDESRNELADEFCRTYTESCEQSSGGHG